MDAIDARPPCHRSHNRANTDPDTLLLQEWQLMRGWQYPRCRDFYPRLAPCQFATLETRIEDLPAALDAAGSEQAVILASHEGCGMAALFAATYPERARRFGIVPSGRACSDRQRS
jgi:pimeloyl-ACP methyl ester carboxylesterase